MQAVSKSVQNPVDHPKICTLFVSWSGHWTFRKACTNDKLYTVQTTYCAVYRMHVTCQPQNCVICVQSPVLKDRNCDVCEHVRSLTEPSRPHWSTVGIESCTENQTQTYIAWAHVSTLQIYRLLCEGFHGVPSIALQIMSFSSTEVRDMKPPNPPIMVSLKRGRKGVKKALEGEVDQWGVTACNAGKRGKKTFGPCFPFHNGVVESMQFRD